MRITSIRERTVRIAAPIANAYIDFSEMTLSLVAVVTDVTRDGRVEHRASVTDLLAAIRLRTRDELVAALVAADVPAGPVNRVSEALATVESAYDAADHHQSDSHRR